MLALVILLLSFVRYGASVNCVSCATPALNHTWGITGFPAKPADLIFTPDCGKSSADVSLAGNVKPCDSTCFELSIPLNSQYEIVRGCHGTFMAANNNANLTVNINAGTGTVASTTDVQTNTVPACTVSLVAGEITYVSSKAEPAKSGMRFCNENENVCNTRFEDAGPPKCDGQPDVQATTTCISCIDFDGEGKCGKNAGTTCVGVYCTKVEGQILGKYYIERGCAAVTPFQVGGCAWSEIDSVIYNNMPNNYGEIIYRPKRDLGMRARLTKCFCQGDRCNTTPSYFSWPMLLLIGIGTVFLLK